MMVARAAIVLALLLSAGVYGSTAGGAEAIVPRKPLAELPLELGEWRGREASPFADDVLAQLGVDDYINRQYLQAGSAPVGIYVGYYASQRQGDTIHSPQNCLPGSGWRPIETRVTRLPVAGREVPVNHFLIQKGLDRQVVFYWYQGRGRVIANEYANKALLMLDAARLHRTNGGLVRMITPVVTTAEAATRELTAFATLAFPLLDAHLP
jgi:EpsI family protein